MKKAIQTIAIFFLCIFILLTIAGFFLCSKVGESWIRRIAENHLTQLLEVPVSIGILETNLFNRLQIEDFRISQSVDQPILYLKKAGINYNVFKLLQKSLDIKSLNLDSMTLFIERDSSGRFVFDYLNSLLKPDTTTSQFTVALQQFHIERSLFQYNDLSIPLNGALAQTFIHVRQTADSTYQLQLRSAQSNITIKQILVVFSDVQVDADLKNGNITLAEFQSVSAELTLSGSLTTTLPELEASLRIQGNPQTSLKTSLPELYSTLSPFDGEIDVNINARGKLPAPDIELQAIIPQLTISGTEFKDGHFDASYYSDSLIVRQLTAKTDGGSITANAFIVNDSLWQHSATLSIFNLNLQQIWATIFQNPILQSGLFNASITTKGALKNIASISSSGNISLSNLIMLDKPVPDITASVQLQDGQLSTELQNNLTRGTITADLSNEQVNARYSFNIHEIEPLAQLANITDISGRLTLDGSIIGTYKNPKINASISVSNLNYQHFPVDELVADLSYFDKIITINSSQFRGELPRIQSATAPFGLDQLQGAYAYRGHLQGTVPTLLGMLEVEMAQPGYSGYQFDSGQISIEFQDERVMVKDLSLIKSSGQIRSEGTFSIPDRQANATIRLQSISSEKPDFGIITGNADLKNMDNLDMTMNGSLIDLNRIRFFLPDFPEMDGILDFGLTLSKNIERPEIHFQSEIHSFNYQHLQYDSIAANIGFRENRLIINPLMLSKPGEKIHLTADVPIFKKNGQYTIDKKETINGRLTATNINLDPFNPLIPADIFIQGKSNLNIALSGTVKKPVWNGSISLEQGDVRWTNDQPPLTDLMLKMNLNKDEIQVEYLSGIYADIPFLFRSTVTTKNWKQFQNRSQISVHDKEILTIKGNFNSQTVDLNARFDDINLADFTNLYPGIHALQGLANGDIAFSGSWQEPDVNGRLNVEKGLFRATSNSPPLTDLVLRVSYQKSRLNLENLSGSINDLPFRSTGELDLIGKDEFTGNWRLNIQGRETLVAAINSQKKQINVGLNIDQFDLALLQSFTPEEMITEGYLSSNISLSGSYTKPHINGFIRLSDGLFRLSDNSPPIEELQIETVIQDTILDFHNFTGLIRNTPFSFDGHLQRFGWRKFQIVSVFNFADQKIVDIDGLFGRDTLNIQLSVDSLNLSMVKSFTHNITDIQGQLISSLTVSGKPKQPHITGNINIRNASVEIDTTYPRIEALQLTSTFQDTIFTLHSLDAIVSGIPVHTQGTIYTRRFDNFLLNLNVVLAGTDIARSEFSITKTHIDGFAEINNLNLAKFQPLVKDLEQIGGKMNARLKVSGHLAAPKFSANATISEGLLQIRSVSHLMDSVETSITATDSFLQINSFTASLSGLPIQITGRIDKTDIQSYNLYFEMLSRNRKILYTNGTLMPKYTDLDIEITDLDLSVLEPFIPVYRLEGRLNSKIQISGTRVNPRFNGSLYLNNGAVQTDFRQPPIEKIKIDGQIRDNDIQITQLTGYYLSNDFHLSGNVNLAERRSVVSDLTFFLNSREIVSLAGCLAPTQIDARLNINNLDIGIFKDFRPELYLLSGVLNSSVAIQGSLNQPKINGEVTFHSGAFQLSPETPAISSISLKTTLRDTVAQVVDCRATIQNTVLKLSGTLASQDWTNLSTDLVVFVNNNPAISAKGRISADDIRMNLLVKHFNLSFLQPFTTQFQQLNGDINSSININGSLMQPIIGGKARISEIRFQPAIISETFTDGLISLRFEQTRFILDTLAFKLNKGSITGSGYFAYREKDIGDIDLKTTLNNISVSQKKQYLVTLKNSTLRLRRENNYYNLDGDVVFDETRVQYNIQPKTLIAMAQSSRRPGTETSQLMKKIRMNIRIRDSKNIWIDNNLSRIRLRPELAIIGTAAKTNISGRLKVEEGYILYLDRKFKVKQGVIDFIDPNTINPIIDFTAASEIKSYQTLSKKAYTVTITITGPLDEAVFDLQSQPPLDKSDIIALLTFGATREELIGRGLDSRSGGVGAAIQERLTEYSSQRISSFTSQKVGTLLGLEEMSIEGNLFSFGKSWGPQLVASKKLTERMCVTYSTTVGHTNEQNVKLDYKLNDKFSLEGQTDQRGRSGLDLKYKLKFK